ncbi:GNAT family N-acetyltransferase [Amycolatopsis jejuensis]|uniref:GNAT family N-acetyltransferase n=1 Tax=Amycolatopsis jejuensis TaxID=330084 RepID=UPI0005265E69|nr:GNAT family N-acetyltransferase [Amycolatopsis jejuensis]
MRVVDFGRLAPRELDAWHTLRAANPVLDSPYFHPAFAAAVHAEGPPVKVAIVEEGNQITALFPVHTEGGIARPAGWPAADFQSPILAAGNNFPVAGLLPALKTGAFGFDHLLDPGKEFAPWIESAMPSPFLDVEGGLDAYLARASRSGKDNMGQARRRAAKAAREHGELRFVADNRDPALLDEVIRLKRGQYAATGARDYFAEPSRKALLHRLFTTKEDSFSGLLSTVHVGQKLLAAHFGIRDGGVLHWWFPVYDPAFARLAPGWILLRELVQSAPHLGVHRIDLGRGEDEYKRRAMTGQVTVHQGQVSRGGLRKIVRKVEKTVVDKVKESPLAPHLRAVVRRLR